MCSDCSNFLFSCHKVALLRLLSTTKPIKIFKGGSRAL